MIVRQMNRLITGGLMVAFSFLCAANAHGAEQPDKPNILFILADRQSISFPAPSSKPFIKFEVTASRSGRERFLAAIGELDVLVAPQTKQPATGQ
ncbi:MAG TPA: hypothetical protein VMY37_32495 [Thermoguttaceae bacterium]|nr:hypothetical protein [Thermoguttaceae bacterium]